jgi:hypothetical protein
MYSVCVVFLGGGGPENDRGVLCTLDLKMAAVINLEYMYVKQGRK